MTKNTGWLRWETKASIHHLAITAQASQTPLFKYFGSRWPKTVMIYKGQNVIWSNEWGKLYDLGAEMVDFYKDLKNRSKYIGDWNKSIDDLNEQLKQLDQFELKSLSSEELLKRYNAFCEAYIKFWAIAWFDEPVAFECERLLKDEGIASDDLTILLAPTWKPFVSEIEEDLLAISKSKKDQKKLIENHLKKYFWKRNSYLKAFELTAKDIAKEISVLKKSELQKTGNQSLKVGPVVRKIVEVMDDFGKFQDERKKQMMIAAAYIEKFLTEIGRRSNLSLNQMRYVLKEEIKDILDGKNIKDEIINRQKQCAVVWEGDKYEILYGKDVSSLEKELFGAGKSQVMEVVGMTACPGTAVGKAIIIKDSKEANKVKEGAILIAPMTSPDYVIAMKKAAAIVTDWGGMTSHAAIVAREFGIPCVVGTDVATKVFKDGDVVEVLADEGVVRKI